MPFTMPMLLNQIEVLLSVHFKIMPFGICMAHLNAVINHLLEEMDEIGFFQTHRFAEGQAGVTLARGSVMGQQLRSAGRGEFGYAGIFAVGFVGRNRPVNARDQAISGENFLRIIRWVLSAMLIALKPKSIYAQYDVP